MSEQRNPTRTQDLLAAIQEIRAIDNHSHAIPARRPEPHEGDLPNPLGETRFPFPARLRVTNPEYIEAWRALYSYPHQDMSEGHIREALQAKLHLMREKGDAYPSWILDRAGVERTLVVTRGLGPGQVAPRFLWVPPAGDLLSPFERSRPTGRETPDEAHPAATLEDYVDDVVKPQVQGWRTAGAVAIKFVIAYYRSLDVADVPLAAASASYERSIRGGSLSALERKALQDYLFRAVAREAGRVGLAVHVHTGVGENPYFNISGSNPLLLEPVFNDETLRQTQFVMLHGGWPFERQAGVMLMKPNVYADFSAQTFLRSTQALSRTLEEWLSWYPEKVLFGTDACPVTPLTNWEEHLWLCTRTARQALTLALARMITANEIDRPRAEELARMVLRGNAAALYGLQEDGV